MNNSSVLQVCVMISSDSENDSCIKDDSLSDSLIDSVGRHFDDQLHVAAFVIVDAISDDTRPRVVPGTRYRANSKEWLLVCVVDWRYVTIYATPCVPGKPFVSETEFRPDWLSQIVRRVAQEPRAFSFSSTEPWGWGFFRERSLWPFSFRLDNLLSDQFAGKECWRMRAPSESAAASAFCALRGALHNHAEFRVPNRSNDNANWDLTRRECAFVSRSNVLSRLPATLAQIAEHAIEVFSCPLERELRVRGLCKQDAVGWCEGDWFAF